MDQNSVNKALSDVALIKDVLDRTAASFRGCSRIFLWWGGISLIPSVLAFVSSMMAMNMLVRNPMMNPTHDPNPHTSGFLSILSMTLFFVMLIVGYIIYCITKRSIPLTGISKELMALWGWAILITLLQTLSGIVITCLAMLRDLPTYHYSIPLSLRLVPMTWYIFGMALMATGILARMGALKWLALVYALLAFCDPLLRLLFHFPIDSFIYPITFFLLGGYLEWQRRRGAHATV
jgi:hypothetical protein